MKANNPPQTPLPPIKSNVIFGATSLMLFLGLFLAWGFLFRLDSAALATGKIITDSYTKKIQHLEGGIIHKIHIKDGAEVKKGDLLIELDSTQSESQVGILQSRYIESLVRVARLESERDELGHIVVPNVEKKYNVILNPILKDQTRLFQSRRSAYASNMKILEQRIEQLNDQVQSYEAQVASSDEQIQYLEEEIQAYQDLKKKEYVDRPRMLALQREKARLLGEKGENLGLIASTKQKIGETETQMINLKDERQKEILEELNKAQLNLTDTLEKLTAAEDILKRSKIYSPVAGTVVGLTAHTIGGVVSPGEVIMDVVPKNDNLVIEARVNPIDIDMIHKGLTANVHLTAYKMRSTPSVKGFVEHVSADVFKDEREGTMYYKAIVRIDDAELAKLDQEIILIPGMPVDVAIIVDKRSAMQYFIGPITASFKRAFKEQ